MTRGLTSVTRGLTNVARGMTNVSRRPNTATGTRSENGTVEAEAGRHLQPRDTSAGRRLRATTTDGMNTEVATTTGRLLTSADRLPTTGTGAAAGHRLL